MKYLMDRGAWKLALRMTLTAALLALLGCGGGSLTTPAPTPGDKQPQTLAERRIEGRKMLARQRLANRPTLEERRARHRAFQRVVPAEAAAALERAGLPAVQPVRVPAGKHASTVLPAFIPAWQQYAAPGDAGYFGSSSDVVFTPPPDFPEGASMSPAGAGFPDSFSYIIYRVDDVTQLPAQLNLYLNISPPPGTEAGVAVYNWGYGDKGRWEAVFYGDVSGGSASAPLDTTPGAQWMNAANNLAFAIFALNPNALDINGCELSDAPPNFPPFADLFANPGSGPAPLLTTLDASGSSDFDGTIVNYSFDPGDGSGWADNGSDSTFDYTYLLPGPYTATVEVTDDGGLTAQYQTAVIVSPLTYDELEDNDDFSTAQAFPVIPFSDFSGACGTGGNNDGDTDDWFTFNANAGDKISLQCLYSQSGPTTFDVLLWDSTFSFPLAELWSDPTGFMNYEFQGWETGPFYIEVNGFEGASDYYISCGDDFVVPLNPNEVEDNDDDTMADQLPFEWGSNTFTSWIGNLGDDPSPDYPSGHRFDGDDEDWSNFGESMPVVDGATITLTLTYDTVNSTAMSITLYDGQATQLAFSGNGSGTEVINHTVQPGEVQPFFVKLRCGGGYGDYNLAGELEIPNPGFDEDENNDNLAEANDIGPVPLPAPFTGNVGWSGSYDGDSEDYFTYQANPGDIVEFTVTPAGPAFGFFADLIDGNGSSMGGSSTDVNGVVTCKALVLGNTPLPLHLVVGNWDVGVDYQIEAALGSFDEVENNDTEIEANSLPNDFVPFFCGSLGTGGTDYDGDNLDMFTFTSILGEQPSFNIHYDNGTGIGFAGIIRDSDGDILGVGSDPQNDGNYFVQTTNPLQIGDQSPFYLQLICPGYTDYWYSGDTGQ